MSVEITAVEKGDSPVTLKVSYLAEAGKLKMGGTITTPSFASDETIIQKVKEDAKMELGNKICEELFGNKKELVGKKFNLS